jgi:hypothetical protein
MLTRIYFDLIQSNSFPMQKLVLFVDRRGIHVMKDKVGFFFFLFFCFEFLNFTSMYLTPVVPHFLVTTESFGSLSFR